MVDKTVKNQKSSAPKPISGSPFYKGKNISVGVGSSNLEDGYQAGVCASKDAANKSSNGAQPSFSLVFVSSKYNSQIDKVVSGINKILGTNWIGCTTDREINSIFGYSEGTVQVLCIDTKYLHFGVGVSPNYREDPMKNGEKTIKEAIDNCPVERSKFATAQFMRGSKKTFTDIVKNPPYAILTFIGGIYYENHTPISGLEEEFFKGIKDVVGYYTPIIGASAAEDVEEASKKGEGENYVFANGKAYNQGAVVCFIVSELYFGTDMDQGYESTGIFGTITKVSGNGRIIEELNNKPAIDEYCRLAGYKKEEFMKNPIFYFSLKPICAIDIQGFIYPKMTSPMSLDAKETKLVGNIQNIEKNPFTIGNYNEKATIDGIKNNLSSIMEKNKNKKIAFVLNFDCSIRRMQLREKIGEEISACFGLIDKGVLFGFYTMGEIGGKYNFTSRYNNATTSSLCIFDQIYTE